MLIVIGDLNVIIGLERTKDEEEVRSPYGIGQRNERRKIDRILFRK